MNTAELTTYLQDLRANNSKFWFDAHRPQYDLLRGEFTELVQDVIAQMIPIDPTLKGVEAKRSLFRINRDVRFSHNKAPYKTQFSAVINGGPRDETRAGYYFHINADGELLVGGGVHTLTPAQLNHVRTFIANNYPLLETALSKAAAKKFSDLGEDKLKNVPKTFPADHPAGELLKYKSFIISHSEPVANVHGSLSTHITRQMEEIVPFVDFIQRALQS